MNLYLSSYRIPTPHDVLAMLPESPEKTKVAIIVNAKDDGRPKEESEHKLKAVRAYLQELGFVTSYLDLKKYKNSQELSVALDGVGLLYAAGGNAFALRYYMRESGFDALLPELLEAGVTYVGESAGAVVVGHSLKGFETVDTPEKAPEIIFEGIGIINAVVIPHTDDPAYADRVKPISDLYAGKTEVITLKNNQAYVVSGDSARMVVS